MLTHDSIPDDVLIGSVAKEICIKLPPLKIHQNPSDENEKREG